MPTLKSLIAKGIPLKGNKSNATVDVLVDTGASYSMVRADIAEKLGTPAKLPSPIVLTIGDGSKISITEYVMLAMEIGAVKLMDYFLIFQNLIEEAILGVNTMRQYGLKIDLETQSIYAEIREGENMKDFLKKLFAAIGISAAEDIGEDKAIELVKEKVGAGSAAIPKTVLTALDLKDDASEAEVRGAILALKSPGNVVPLEKYDELALKLRDQSIEMAVLSALIDGKITPAEKDEWLKQLKDGSEKLETFKAFTQRRGKVFPLNDKLPDDKKQTAGALIDDVQSAVNAQLGISAETFAKYNKES